MTYKIWLIVIFGAIGIMALVMNLSYLAWQKRETTFFWYSLSMHLMGAVPYAGVIFVVLVLSIAGVITYE